jgi:cold shock CspA family protein
MDTLREGQKISFEEVREDPKTRKSSATNLRVAS